MANHDLILGQNHNLALGQNQPLVLGHDHNLGLTQNHDLELGQTHERHSGLGQDHDHDLGLGHSHDHDLDLGSHDQEGDVGHSYGHDDDLATDQKPDHGDHELALAENNELAVVEGQELDDNLELAVDDSQELGIDPARDLQAQMIVSLPPVLQARNLNPIPTYELAVGQEFPDVKSCRRALRDTAIALHFEMQTIKSDKTRFTAKCATEGCPWRIHAAKLPGVPTFTIRTIHETHTCGGIAHLGHQQASVQWVANSVEQRLRENPNYKPKEILEEIHRVHGITLSYKQAWRGKERIMAAMRGSFEEAYRLLPQYCEQVKRTNPGSIASVYGNPTDYSFQRLFISFQASIYAKILEIEEISQDAAYWIRRIPPRLWATAYFEGTRFGHLTANIVESLNNWILEASGLPVIQMMECIRRQLMTWFNERRETSMQWTSILVPTAERRVADALERARTYQVLRANEAEFEVISQEGTNIVDIRNRCCLCRGWQLYGLPCAHAVAALLSCRQNVHRFTESCFTVATYRKTYSQTIHPIPDKSLWKELTEGDPNASKALEVLIYPPKSLKPPGRPRKKRVRAEDRGRVKRVVHCSRCNQTGSFPMVHVDLSEDKSIEFRGGLLISFWEDWTLLYFKQSTPCLLCSRLDHVFGKEKLKFYWDLVCCDHKLEISSLVYCHAHNKLVDVHGMCESCLFSFATINKSNAETYRLLVGKLGEHSDFGLHEDPSLEDQKLGHSPVRHCSCCNEPWMPKGYVKTLIQTQSTVSQNAEFDLPSPVSKEHGQDDLKNRSDNASVSVKAKHQRERGPDPLSHVAYTELKINSDSDSESEVSSVAGDEEEALILQTDHLQRDIVDQHVQPESCTINVSEDFASVKLIDPLSETKPSISVSQSQTDIVEPLGTKSVESIDLSINGLEELNWKQASSKAEASEFSDLISLEDDVPVPSNDRATYIDVSTEMNLESPGKVFPLPNADEIPTKGSEDSKNIDYASSSSPANETPVEVPKESNPISIDDVSPSNFVASPIEESKESSVMSTLEVEKKSVAECEEICKPREQPLPIPESPVETNHASSDTSIQVPNSLDLSDAYKLAVGSRGRQLSGLLVEQWIGKESSRLSEDLKALLSQLSARGFEQSTNDASPRIAEEKATLQMEALQNLRIMEEQAEYDMEALQQTNDLLAEKEKEIQELEAELEFYRMKFHNVSMLGDIVKPADDFKARWGTEDHSETNGIEERTDKPPEPVSEKPNVSCTVEETNESSTDSNQSTMKNQLPEYEEGCHE
ncbi:Transposase, MuDR, plant [Corchorus olitorius]|uniref:Transposase, MuDR, plant n=1 Tax=Corchorus olitorius TaxID=93759 RepID=A0A1R3JMY5_9ROSI|nr:Transposase, MuDR, plant [Corchorus olitorius]